MDQLAQAIAGQTVIIPFTDLWIDPYNTSGFASLADLQAWCTTFGLLYEELTEIQSYKIFKA